MTYNKYKINTMSSVHIDEFYAVSYQEAESFAIKFCDLYGIKAFHLVEVPRSFDINYEPADDDTDKQEAWVAKKNGILRCFMENKEYPHKSKGSYID